MANTVTLTRKDLYDKVWTTSLLKLAKEFNLSDVALAKICKKHDIPRPGLGYWAKLENGKQVEKKFLPNPKNNLEITIDISGKYQKIFESSILTPEKNTKIYPEFQVSEVLKNPHPLINQTKRIRNENKSVSHRFLEVLDINVHPSEFNRALRIMDTLIKILEKRGHSVKIEKDGYREYKTIAVIKGNEFPISIYMYYNRLTFGLKVCYRERTNWGDSKAIPLEKKLYGIVLKLLQLSRQGVQRQIHWRIQEKEKKRLEALRQEQERLRQEEQKKIEHLEKSISCWKKSLEIREYLGFAKQYVIEKLGGYDDESEFGQWLKWAYEYAERVYPLK